MGTAPARRDGVPSWPAVLVLALLSLAAYALLSQGALALAGQASPGDLPAFVPTGATAGTVPGRATPASFQPITATVTPLAPILPITATVTPPAPSPAVTPTLSPTATAEVVITALPVIGQLPPLPTPTPPPPLPTYEPAPGEPHGDYEVTTASCAGCHRAHTARGLALRKVWPEETLCFSCHGAAGPGTDVETAFTASSNTATRFFKHDVALTNGIHRVGETEGTDFGGANRHVECEDCHDPHAAARGDTTPPWLQREMERTAGVDPLWLAPGYTWLPEAEREYQVCFKCHSSFTELPTYPPDGWDGQTYVPDGLRKLTYAGSGQVPDQRDMALEFNPYNASFHPVVTQGRNQAIPAGSFVNGWSPGSMVYCTDCHTNADPAAGGVGPHGSPLLHLLGGSDDYQTVTSGGGTMSGGELCFNCHDAEDYLRRGTDTNFIRNRANLHRQHANNGPCYVCHDTHGSEQLHLLNLDSSIETSSNTYFLPGYDGILTDSQTFWQISPDGTQKSCWLVCHGHNHSRSSYPNLND
jgi:predicted CXXCH cytochrome family protein